MFFTRRLFALSALFAIGSLCACSAPPSVAGGQMLPNAFLPQQRSAVTPDLPYFFTFLNYTSSAIHLRSFGGSCMRRLPSEMTVRPNRTWETRLDTRGSGRCLTRQSVFYMSFTRGVGGPFDIQFTKRVTSQWRPRTTAPFNSQIRFCWYSDGLGGTAVLVNGTRCIV